jgi:hypothetical protein
VIELERPRDARALLRESLLVYVRHFWTFLALGALVVVPTELIVGGIGLEQFSAGYDGTPGFAEAAIPAAVSYLVVAPLITAICVHALRSVAAGGSAGAREAIVRGFESFRPIFFAVVLAAAGILVGALLIIPAVYLFVRWYFVPQAVVIEGAHGAAALRASGRLVQGSWWRSLGLIVLVNVAVVVIGILVGTPFTAAADSSDRALWALIGQIVAGTLTQPFGALYSTLLYYDLRERKRAALG